MEDLKCLYSHFSSLRIFKHLINSKKVKINIIQNKKKGEKDRQQCVLLLIQLQATWSCLYFTFCPWKGPY